jgi:nucleoside 2-deoxyribosyltransferase
MPRTAFLAYPARPEFVAQTLLETVRLIDTEKSMLVTPWPKLHTNGLKIDDLIRDRIRDCDLLLADITYPNFNVYYEIGFAIASQKPFVPLVNYSAESAHSNVTLIGIFDTIGQIRYQNASELAKQLSSAAF